MSIDRGDRIIVMMARSLCCCSNRTKVADSNEESIGKAQLKNVFIVCTQNVFTRTLTGKLIIALEDRHLLPVHMKLIRPTQEMIDKSHLLKDERHRQLDEVWMFFVFRGRDSYSRVSDCVKQFRTQYALHKNDIYWTENEKDTEYEEHLFFPNEEKTTVNITSNGEIVPEVVEDNGAVEPSVEKEVEGSRTNSEISTESIQIPPLVAPEDVTSPNEEHPNAEVISNTADILEPVVVVQSARMPAPEVETVISQPTKVE